MGSSSRKFEVILADISDQLTSLGYNYVDYLMTGKDINDKEYTYFLIPRVVYNKLTKQGNNNV